MASIPLTCYLCGEGFSVINPSDDFQVKLLDYNASIAECLEMDCVIPIDFSFCVDCLKGQRILLDQEAKYLKSNNEKLEKEAEVTKGRLMRRGTFENVPDLSKDIMNLDKTKEEISDLNENIEKLASEKVYLEKSILALIEDTQQTENKYKEFLDKINKTECELINLSQKLKMVKERKELYDLRLTQMKGFSVLNEVFRIEISEHIGKINGQSIGVMPYEGQPDWKQMNNGFGMVVLLMNYLVRKRNVSFNDLKLVFYGGESYIWDQIIGEKYSFHGPIKLETLKNFNFGIKYLLEFEKRIYERLAGLLIDSKINGDKDIGEHFSRYQDQMKSKGYDFEFRFDKNSLINWTKAMKFFLTSLKILICLEEKLEETEF